MLLQVFKLDQQFVKGDHLHILTGVAEHLKATQFFLFYWPASSEHYASDDICSGGTQGRIVKGVFLPSHAQLALLMQHLRDSAAQLRVWSKYIRWPIGSGTHQGSIWSFDFHNGERQALLSE